MGLWGKEMVLADERTIVADGLVMDVSMARPGYVRLALRVSNGADEYWVVWTLDPGETEKVARALAGALEMRLKPVT